jgi:hypothetical protein
MALLYLAQISFCTQRNKFLEHDYYPRVKGIAREEQFKPQR